MVLNPELAKWIELREAHKVVSARDENMWLRDYVLPVIGHLRLDAVRGADVRHVLDLAVGEDLAPESVKKIRGCMSRLFREAEREEKIQKNPVTLVEAPRQRVVTKSRTVPTDGELATMLGSVAVKDNEVKVAAALARVVGGMRTGDLLSLQWQSLDLVDFAVCMIPRNKTGQPVSFEIHVTMRPLLRSWHASQGSPDAGPVFPAQRGDNAGGFKATRGNSFAKRLRRAFWLAGVVRLPPVVETDDKGKTTTKPNPADALYFETSYTYPLDFHSTRRAFATALADSGVNVQTAMRLAGHHDAATHGRYVAMSAESKRLPEGAAPSFTGATLVESSSPSSESRSVNRAKGASFPARHRGFEPLTYGSGERSGGPDSGQFVGDSQSVLNGSQARFSRDSEGPSGELPPSRYDSGSTYFGAVVVPVHPLVDPRELALTVARVAALQVAEAFAR